VTLLVVLLAVSVALGLAQLIVPLTTKLTFWGDSVSPITVADVKAVHPLGDVAVTEYEPA
jgi:hypothetical protein